MLDEGQAESQLGVESEKREGDSLPVNDKDEEPSTLPIESIALLSFRDALDVGPWSSFARVARRQMLVDPCRRAEETKLESHANSLMEKRQVQLVSLAGWDSELTMPKYSEARCGRSSAPFGALERSLSAFGAE